jgi:hypothetical protein
LPLYEIVLSYAPEPDETRLTDQLPRVGDTIRINEVDWVVANELQTSDGVDGRFRCERRSVPVEDGAPGQGDYRNAAASFAGT